MPQISPLSWFIIPFFVFFIFFFMMVGFWWSMKFNFFFSYMKDNFNGFALISKVWLW